MRFRYRGRFPAGEVTVEGRWPVPHAKYGEQLEVERVVDRGAEADWLYQTLRDLPGIGQVTIGQLRQRFGASIFDVLDRPQALSSLADVAGAKRASVIVAWWRQLAPWLRDLQRGMRTADFPGPTRAATEAYLRQHGLWGRYVDVAVDLDGMTMTVPADPFPWARPRSDRDRDEGDPLRVVEGVSLGRADRFAAAVGVPASAPDRVIATAVALLEEAASAGHVCLPTDGAGGLVPDLSRRLSLDSDVRLDVLLGRAVEAGEIVVDESTNSVYRPRLYAAERTVATAVLERVGAWTRDQIPEPPPGLSGEQVQAFRRAFAYGMSIVTGPPGRGKSRTVVAVADAAQRLGLSVLLTAPTGRAAVRLKELATEFGIEFDTEPGTVHRLLLGRKGSLERRGLLVVEESSMLDIEVAGRALGGLPGGWRVVLVGDSGQLAPVGPGRFLADLVSSGKVPVTELTTNYRTEVAGLARAVDDIRLGKTPRNAAGFELREVSPDRFSTKEETLSVVADALAELAATVGCAPTDVMVLTPRRKGGPSLHTATHNLNPPLRARLNPSSVGLPDDQLGLGDKVIHRRNDYAVNRFNGERGVVVGVGPSGNVVVDFGDGTTDYRVDEARDLLRLAFMSTVHSAQGGEADAVLVLVRASDGWLLRRRLIYTAISRARRHCLVLVEPGAFGRALRDVSDDRRHGNLLVRLRGGR